MSFLGWLLSKKIRKLSQIAYTYYIFIFCNMTVPQSKHTLPNLLKKISLKLNSLLLQKLILLEQQKIDYKNVRHYDLECEGIQMFASFFKNKQQNLLFKAFATIRESPIFSQEKVAQVTQKPHGTTRRTYLNTTFTASQFSPIKEIFCPTIRSQRSEKAQSLTAKSQLNRTSTNLQHLLNRVKLVNCKQDPIYSFRESHKNNSKYESRDNYSYCAVNPCSSLKAVQPEVRHRTNPSNLDQKDLNPYNYEKSQITSTRNSRRQFIMDKFNQIENQLQYLNARKQPKKPQLSKQILHEINNIKQRLKLQL